MIELFILLQLIQVLTPGSNLIIFYEDQKQVGMRTSISRKYGMIRNFKLFYFYWTYLETQKGPINLLIWTVISCLVFTAPEKWRVELRAKTGHYRNRCFSRITYISSELWRQTLHAILWKKNRHELGKMTQNAPFASIFQKISRGRPPDPHLREGVSPSHILSLRRFAPILLRPPGGGPSGSATEQMVNGKTAPLKTVLIWRSLYWYHNQDLSIYI